MDTTNINKKQGTGANGDFITSKKCVPKKEDGDARLLKFMQQCWQRTEEMGDGEKCDKCKLRFKCYTCRQQVVEETEGRAQQLEDLVEKMKTFDKAMKKINEAAKKNEANYTTR